MSSVEEAFKAKLVALNTAAGSRVFREVIQQEPEMPAISFIRTGGSPMRREVSTGRPTLNRASFRVEVIASSSSAAESVAGALRTGLDGFRGTVSGVDILRCACVFQGDASYIDGDLFLKVVQQDFDVTYR